MVKSHQYKLFLTAIKFAFFIFTLLFAIKNSADITESNSNRLEKLSIRLPIDFSLKTTCYIDNDIQKKTETFKKLLNELYELNSHLLKAKGLDNTSLITNNNLNTSFNFFEKINFCILDRNNTKRLINETSDAIDYFVNLFEKYKQAEIDRQELDKIFSIGEIETLVRHKVKVAFENELPHLVTLDMTPSQLIQAEYIDLSNLGLLKIPEWLEKFRRLRNLNLAGNLLSVGKLHPIKSMQVLESLNLSNNPLIDVEVEVDHESAEVYTKAFGVPIPFTKHHIYWTNENVIATSSTPSYFELQNLLDSFPNLSYLDLSHTHSQKGKWSITENFKFPAKLETINLNNNHISSISLAIFSSALQEIYLSNNNLSADGIKFAPIPLLQKLVLKNNSNDNGNIVYLPKEFDDAFQIEQLRSLDIDQTVSIPEQLDKRMKTWNIDKKITVNIKKRKLIKNKQHKSSNYHHM